MRLDNPVILKVIGKRLLTDKVYKAMALCKLSEMWFFEPSEPRGFNWVDYTFKQVEAAFRMGKPANISSHRVNFFGQYR